MKKIKYIIIDLECTCWDRHDPLKEQHETIEIGAVFLNKDFKKIGQLQLYTMPKNNKTLSQYCIDLTGITPQVLTTKSISFPEAINKLKTFINLEEEPVFGSWGKFDQTQLIRDCYEWDIPYPFSKDNHINIKTEFMQKYNKKKCGLQKACRILKLRFNGAPHCGLDDANMIAEVFREIQKDNK